MLAPSEDLAAFLASQMIGDRGAAKGWSLNTDVSPPSPDTSITLIDYDGDGPDTDELDLFRPRVQVAVRARSKAAAYEKQQQIRVALSSVTSISVGGTLYISITPITDIISIGQDDNNRFILTQNFQVLRS